MKTMPFRPAGQRSLPLARILAAIAVIGILLALMVLGLTSADPQHRLWAPVAIFALLSGTVALSERRRHGRAGLASPVSLIAVSWFLFLGLTSLNVLRQQSTYGFGLTSRDIVAALWLAVVSVALITVGYRVVGRIWATLSLDRDTPRASVETCTKPVVFALLAIGWAATLYLFSRGEIGYLAKGRPTASGLGHFLLSTAASLLSLGLVTLGIVVWSGRRFPDFHPRLARWALLANIPPLVAISLGGGVKGALITSLVPVGAVYLIFKGRVPWKALILVVAYLVFTFGGIQQFRSNIASGNLSPAERYGIVGPVKSAASSVVHDWTSSSVTSHWNTFWQNLTSEYASLPQTIALIRSHTPSPIPYVGAERFLAGPFFFLPSSRFETPGFNLGTYVSSHYLGAVSETAAAPTQPGDLLMSGGLPAMVLGELLIGMFLGSLWRLLRPSPARVRSTAIYAVIAADFFNGGLDVAGLVRNCLQEAIVLGIICWIVFPKQPVQRSEQKPIPLASPRKVVVHRNTVA